MTLTDTVSRLETVAAALALAEERLRDALGTLPDIWHCDAKNDTIIATEYEGRSAALTASGVAPEHWRFVMHRKSTRHSPAAPITFVCEHCGRSFTRRAGNVRRQPSPVRFCSVACREEREAKIRAAVMADLEREAEASGIPRGYCQCGCGQRPGIAPHTDVRNGLVKGEPRRFCVGHHPFVPNDVLFPGNGTAIVELTGGYTTTVDAEDWPALSRYRWVPGKNKNGNVYVMTNIRINGERGKLLMHRVLMNAPETQLVDHKNGDTLDNRRSNLRLCTKRQNCCNAMLQKSNTTGYKGVIRSGSKWHVQMSVSGERLHLGNFDTPEEAALAYDEAAREYHGEFATLNFPREGERGAR